MSNDNAPYLERTKNDTSFSDSDVDNWLMFDQFKNMTHKDMCEQIKMGNDDAWRFWQNKI